MKTQEVLIILDQSGSMNSILSSTIDSFNEFITSIQTEDIQNRVTLHLFNHESVCVYASVPAQKVVPLTTFTYQPSGTTAMLDAIGEACTTLHSTLESRAIKPDKVLCCILTDGAENSSRRHNYESVHKQIGYLTEFFNWKFIFLGANIDVKKESSQLGIDYKNTFKFSHDESGIKESMHMMCEKVLNFKE